LTGPTIGINNPREQIDGKGGVAIDISIPPNTVAIDACAASRQKPPYFI
jgi:hypothetical protein